MPKKQMILMVVLIGREICPDKAAVKDYKHNGRIIIMMTMAGRIFPACAVFNVFIIM